MDTRLRDLSHLVRRPLAAWRKAGWWGQTPLWERVQQRAEYDPQRVAVIDEAGLLTTGELWADALSVAAALRADGIERGDIVLVQVPNWREFVILVVAIELCGAVLGFCPASWGARETGCAVDLLRPKIWIADRQNASPDGTAWIEESLNFSGYRPGSIVTVRSQTEGTTLWQAWTSRANIAPIDAARDGGRGADPLEIALTSGSTGEPKGVLHVHDSALATVQSTILRQGITPDDVIHLAIPVGHTFGYFYGVRCALQSGATLLLQERWNAQRAAHLVAAHRATVSLGPAACIVDFLALDAADLAHLASLRLFTQSGDPLPQPVAERAIEKLPFRISRALGMTEFGHAAATDGASPRERVIDSAGSPQPGIMIEIRNAEGLALPPGNEGSVHVTGPFLFSGYIRADRLDIAVLDDRGFFATRDLGWLGDDGYLHITGREHNVIRRGAITIPVVAVEDAIATHPAISHAVVVGVSDMRLGEIPAVCVQTRAGISGFSLDELKRHLERLGITRTFWPEALLVITEWPLGASGKIDRGDLIQRLTRTGLHEPPY